MKIRPETFKELKEDIDTVISRAGFDVADAVQKSNIVRVGFSLLSIVNLDRAYHDHPTYKVRPRFLSYTGRKYRWLHDQGLNDSHIETALKSILSEYI
ncbi:MAG: hypothetical protein VST71_06660 [Nitrospirota bacterium]|nr:hypothetical protein [Nitrospirota bacterium]